MVSRRPGDWPSPRSSALTTTYFSFVQKTGSGVSHALYFDLCSGFTSLNDLEKKLPMLVEDFGRCISGGNFILLIRNILPIWSISHQDRELLAFCCNWAVDIASDWKSILSGNRHVLLKDEMILLIYRDFQKVTKGIGTSHFE
jgi:hypothetical protein